MPYTLLSPRQTLNKAFLKVRPAKEKVELFRANLRRLLGQVNKIEREENQKNYIRDFLRDTYYRDANEINTKGTIDLVIHLGPSSHDKVGVILEAKRPSNRAEMLSRTEFNTKAMQEILLYYLKERILYRNLEIKWLVITNVYEWFIFDAMLFEHLFATDKQLVSQFQDFEAGRLGSKETAYFYQNIARPHIDAVKSQLSCTFFDIREYAEVINCSDSTSISKTVSLFKILSPEHLLKLPLANDSNQLDKGFYEELLHIIGLAEVRDGSKKFIRRLNAGFREPGSLLEMTLFQIEDRGSKNTYEKSLDLVITWVNRILFLKLLEAQLLRYHKDSKAYSFVDSRFISGFDELNDLFFKVLGVRPGERHELIRDRYSKVPYLNSSLFERTELEQEYFPISQLTEGDLNLHKNSILLDEAGRKKTGKLKTLDYFFKFLDSYDFSSEGSEEVQDRDRPLINASVLGLIFEKINGYQDGAYFTPGYITMYMSRESVRQAIVNRFNQEKGWHANSFSDLYDLIDDNSEARKIFESIKICDPAVGSGHFLVSVLNELLAAKSELGLLINSNGKRLKNYQISVVDDELITVDEDGVLFNYSPRGHESRLVQEAIFEEKRRIIENCLFGIDINRNSVRICRLRLWIELLKSSYYTSESAFTELETLPNIDINIKCGNSLVSRFDIKSDLKAELKKLKFSVPKYRDAVSRYKKAATKDQKREMEELIADLKGKFRAQAEYSDKRTKKRSRLLVELTKLDQYELFGLSQAERKKRDLQKDQLESAIAQVEREIEDFRANDIYEDSFEWRFEFPEVLNDHGDFLGFDLVIGNPPYGTDIDRYLALFTTEYPRTSCGFKDIYKYFFDRSLSLLRDGGFYCLITPNTFLRQPRYEDLRRVILDTSIMRIVDLGEGVFDAVVPTAISLGQATPATANVVEYADLAFEHNKAGRLYDLDVTSVEQSYFQNTRGCIFLRGGDIDSTQKLSLDGVLDFKDAGINYQRVKVGLADKGNSDLSRRLLYEGERESEADIQYWKGTDIERFYIALSTQRWCRQGIGLGHNERVILNAQYFNISPKLIWRQTASQPIVAVDTRGIWFGRSIQAGTIKTSYVEVFSYGFLCGYLNSDFIKRRYEEIVREKGRVFPQVKLQYLRALPIAVPTVEERTSVERLVDELTNACSRGDSSDSFNSLLLKLNWFVDEFVKRSDL